MSETFDEIICTNPSVDNHDDISTCRRFACNSIRTGCDLSSVNDSVKKEETEESPLTTRPPSSVMTFDLASQADTVRYTAYGSSVLSRGLEIEEDGGEGEEDEEEEEEEEATPAKWHSYVTVVPSAGKSRSRLAAEKLGNLHLSDLCPSPVAVNNSERIELAKGVGSECSPYRK
ncbi:hypothetical protein WH47_12864 [Habropoda laboriosa]|uniref:Uncharacterized protein n=1 Tax=Habropoda laboriosa TaxID=597456 RepID=A0A0L7QKF4_9HYME|nr:hypothetical protein WH47_12864 [Habropoda laboriosa]